MSKYLQMNGTSDTIVTYLTFTEIVMDIAPDKLGSGDFANYVNIGSASFSKLYTNDTFSGFSAVYKDGVAQTSGTSFVTQNRAIYRLTLSAPVTTNAFIFNSSFNDLTKGKIYDLKFYNGSTLVAWFNMNTGTVTDQSGNGKTLTLNGGTFLIDATTVVSDSFTRANSTTSLGTADTGQIWTANNGTWGLISNQAYTPGSVTEAVATVTTSKSDCAVSVKMTVNVLRSRLVFRFQDASNYLFIQSYRSPNEYRIYKMEGGTITNLIAVPTAIPTNNDIVKVECSGSTIKVYVNGTLYLTHTSSLFQTANKHGIGVGQDFTARFDDFLVDDLAPPQTKFVKYWNGSSFVSVPLANIKHYNGTSFVGVTAVKRWNGTAWETIV